jgi:hypothetical protein
MVNWFTGGGNPAREQSKPGKRPGWKVRQRARDARPKSDTVKARRLETQFPGLNPPGYTNSDWIRVRRSLQTDFVTLFVLSSILPASKKRREGNEREPKSLHAYLLLAKRGSPQPRCQRKSWLWAKALKTRHGDGVLIVVRERESLLHGQGGQVIQLRERSRYAQCRKPKCAASAAENERTARYWDCWRIPCVPNLSLPKGLNPEREGGGKHVGAKSNVARSHQSRGLLTQDVDG